VDLVRILGGNLGEKNEKINPLLFSVKICVYLFAYYFMVAYVPVH
jgi:hypothetical protein